MPDTHGDSPDAAPIVTKYRDLRPANRRLSLAMMTVLLAGSAEHSSLPMVRKAPISRSSLRTRLRRW